MINGLHTVANLDFVPHQSLHPSPLDWRDQFIYFLLVDRFDNNAPNLPAFAPVQGHRFQGGNLQGIKRRIEHISDLGCTTVWVCTSFSMLYGRV